MESLNFGKLTITQTEAGVEIDSHGAALLKNADIPLLLEFLKQYLSDYADLRSSWRLNVEQLKDTPAEKLAVSVSGKHASTQLTVLDISLTGMFLESDKPLGERGEQVEVNVEFAGEQAVLQGTIIRHDDERNRVAVNFPGCVDANGELCPPEAYRSIFYGLEQIWLDKKLGLQWQ
ncbi:MAG: PilZ domain-containing protein [Halioglobus sp.]|nr:PilZ domain-containing protein [Halioglobus sp.]